MLRNGKLMVLLSCVMIAALLLPMTVFASEDQPAENETSVVIQDEPAQPQTITTDDGVLEIVVPDSSWKQLNDEGSWLALSSGTDHITVEHLSNGEKLPDIAIAGDDIAEVFQVFYSTDNEVFILTGTVEDAHHTDEVRKIIESFQILQYDTKQAVKPAEPVFDIRPIEENMYCIAEGGVHVRAGCSTDYDIIGGVNYGDEVYVNGMVTKDGQDYGWLQIQIGQTDDAVGYVWGEFFDVNQPEPQPVVTDESMFLYDPAGGNIDIFEFTDGSWRSYDGSVIYYAQGDGSWTGSDGSFYYDDMFNPNMDPGATEEEVTVYSADKEQVILYVFTDGTWRDDMNEIYTPNGDGTIAGPHGFPFYETEEDVPDPTEPIVY